ncbi:MAG: 23S rRNA (cytidine(2498)-2'-O)-methyltransferase RlmM [Rhodocyclaceae bacterium]|nr:23S rRNA (cytidine(2498)-2'-O)-methyltransferase RlmM [Rhodocyclaceae bacterium]MCA3027007.1 23S rRNA (cytidine(2498)-2'-O)-methyltransferase RlmM [Rhodocyclaceae bacterium]MCA3033205.1 23S rRNA (cytidine(2498)-2'-O)-methyltransferase RlmM [Rhodocyclaceae bacterium]MCA3036640.1 23S rRNA (cytidine(2498)-2'-O)-methyltransferase RlmM [Rhodocyclaceae bacterium]MCA3046746.1 23S rRNA (cytidine(2498)-2'-O)-methyltransferase RlmM [Rhodocyclaceae bacterium]
MTIKILATIAVELAWLGYCRPGFERDLGIELQERLGGEIVDLQEDCGFVRVSCATTQASFRVSVHDLTFARQLLLTRDAPVALTSNDRVNPIFEALTAFLAARGIDHVVDCRVEYPDTNHGKALSRSAKAIEPRLRELLGEAGMLAGHTKYRAIVFLTPDKQARIGIADMHLSAQDRLGIPRFRMPADAPSRSTLKLAEAIHVFLGSGQDEALQPDMRAVDLGAAPGGWTWQLMQRGLRITAVDNASLKGDLVDNAMVKHLRADGFKYTPNIPVDWLVCDMVEQPARIAKLVAKWLASGWARYAIFNLKLPMKKRNEEVERCRQIIGEALDEAGRSYILQFKQLYHDREEVTGFVMLPSRKERFAHNVAARDKPANTSRGGQKKFGRETNGTMGVKGAKGVSETKRPPKPASSGKTGPGTPVQAKPVLNLKSTLPRAAASPWSVKPLPKRKKAK